MEDAGIELIMQRVKGAKMTRDFATAIRLLRQGLEKHADNITLWQELGACYVLAGSYNRAIEPLEQVLRIDPVNTEAFNELGGVYRRLGQYDKSIAVLEQGLMTSSDTRQINYNLGHTFKVSGRYDAAEECFNQVLEQNPRDVLAINHLGCIQALKGNHTEALQLYHRALQIDPNHPILHLNSAHSYQALGKVDDARKSYELALKSKPGWDDAMNGYAELLMHDKDLSKCDAILENAIKINPRSSELHSSKGYLNVKKGQYGVAEDSYTTALDLDDENMNALNGLELLYEKQGRHADAMKKIQRMEELAPGNLEYELRYSKLLIDQKRLEEAGEKLKGLYRDNLDNTAYLNLLAQYFIRSGHIDKANGCFQRISELEPGNFSYLRDSAWQFMLNQQQEQAAEQLDHYLQKKPHDPTALSMRGDLYENSGDLEKALQSWKKALEFDENNPMILAKVQRLGENHGEDAGITALITDILSESANTGDIESMKRSLSLYESQVQNMAMDPFPDDETVYDEIAPDIESLETIDYEQLLQFEPEEEKDRTDPYDKLTLDVQPEDILRPIDEEVYSKSLKNELSEQLIDDDMPLEYDQTRDGAISYDPFGNGGRNQYDPDEDDYTVDVQGTGFENEDINDTDTEETQFRTVGEPAVPRTTNPAPAASPVATPAVHPAEPVPASIPAEIEIPAEPEVSAEPEMPAEPQVPAVPDEYAVPEEPAESEVPAEPDEQNEIPMTENDIFEEEDEMIPVENSDTDILSADEFPGDRDTSEDEIPTVDDLISEPVDEDELHEFTEVPTIADLIGDDQMKQLEEEPLEENVPSIEDLMEDQEMPSLDDLLADDVPVPEMELQQPEPAEPDFGDDGSETLSLDELANVAHFASDNPDPEIRTVETVGNVLQKVVFQSEERPEFNSVADMFSDLRELTQWLPEDKHTVFMHSLDRLKLDYVIARLKGRPGLLAAASAVRETGGIIPEKTQEKPSLLKTMQYIRNLAGQVPDASQAEALTAQMDQVVSYMVDD